MLVCCGEALIDMVPSVYSSSLYGSFDVCPGGSVYNSALAAARLKTHTAFISKLSSDFLGDKLFTRMTENGVDTRFITRSSDPATLAFVERSDKGDARYAFYANGASDRCLRADDMPRALPPDTDFLLVGSISLVLEPAASVIAAFAEQHSTATLVSYDPNVRPALIENKTAFTQRFEHICSFASIVKLSEDDAYFIYGMRDIHTVGSHILGLGPALVILTKGGQGSAAFCQHACAETAARPVHVVDTIGAGDTFHAACLVYLSALRYTTRALLTRLSHDDLRAMLDFASAAAAITCSRKGAEPPALSELRAAYPECCARME